MRDEEMLASDEITREELGRKNSFAPAHRIIIDISKAKPFK